MKIICPCGCDSEVTLGLLLEEAKETIEAMICENTIEAESKEGDEAEELFREIAKMESRIAFIDEYLKVHPECE